MGSPIALSFEVAFVATLLSTGLSLVVARLRLHREGAGWLLLDALLSSPLVLPPTVLGYLLLVVLGQRSPLGAFWERLTGHGLVFNLEGAVIAATLTSFPLVYQGTRAALEAVDRELLDAARTLGSTSFQAFRRVAIPVARRGILAAVLVGFGRALGDFGATLMVAGSLPGRTLTGSLAIYAALQDGRDEEAASLALIMAGLAVLVMTGATWLGTKTHVR